MRGLWNVAIEELVGRIGHRQKSMEHLDDIYMQMCSVLCRGMDSFNEYRKTRPNIGKQSRLKQPSLCDELTTLWRNYRDKENCL